MLDEQGTHNFFLQTDELWIQPELKRRFSDKEPPMDFQIREALIMFPLGKLPVVQFNDEIQWKAKFKVASTANIEAEQMVYLHQVENIEHIFPPEIEKERVAFVYLFWAGFTYQVVFDFTPNHPHLHNKNEEFQLGNTIANVVLAKMKERTVRLTINFSEQLQSVGLWIAHCLLPYPLAKITERIGSGYIDEAREILINHCTSEFLSTKLVQTWKPIKSFNDRYQIFDDALFMHSHQRYHGSIITLVNQIEGVIVDWLYEIFPTDEIKWKTKSRIEQFELAIASIPHFEYTYSVALQSIIAFLQEEEGVAKLYQKFENWLDNIDSNFVARHPVSHGKYVSEMFNEENSIKLFLLLDDICQFMMFYEVRVLGRDLTSAVDDNS